MLPEALVVSAVDNNSTPVMGATIKWSIVRGSGTLSRPSTTTDEMGRSYMYFTPSAGCDPIVVVRASLEGKPAFVDFTFHFPVTPGESVIGLTTVAGTGIPGVAIDGSLAAQAPLNLPTGLVIDVSGNLYLSESANHRVLKISPDGTIRRFAGTGEAGSGGDGQAAVNAKLNHPAGLALDSAGNLYIADRDNNQVRKVTPEGIIQRVAGPLLPLLGFEGDGGPATQARLWWPEAVAVDDRGSLYIADTFNQRVRKVDSSGIISTIAGRGGVSYSGDDGLATQAQLAFPRGVAVASTGEIYVADTNNHRVRKIDLAGKISTFAGGGWYFPTEDSLPSEIFLKSPTGLVFDSTGNLYVGTEAQMVMISAGGQASRLGGGQQPGFSGDCAPSLSLLNQVTALALDSSGRLYLADQQNHRVRALQRKDAASSFVPILLSAGGLQGSFFTSELTLTNRGTTDATISFAYTKAFGAGEGTAFDFLPAGRQRIFGDALQYLRSVGIPIAQTAGQGGTLRVGFNGLASPAEGAVTVRTTTSVPQGRAGLAYAGIGRESVLSGPAYLCGLRQNPQDRSNVAFQNVGGSAEGEITLQVTVFSGESLFSQTLPEVTLAPGGFYQISGILNSNGLSLNNGFVRVERIRGSAPYNAYGVINDQSNSDGSFIPPQPETQGVVKGLTLPVIVEVSAFESELIITNWSVTPKTLNFEFHASALQTVDQTAKFSLEVAAGRQVIIPKIIDYLRQQPVEGIGPKDATYAGGLFVTAQNGDCQGLFVGARTTAPGGGGAYGLFYTAVPSGRASTDHAWLLGLQQNAENRSNLAIVNTGEVDGSPSEFSIDIYDGATGGKVGSLQRTVETKTWVQINAILAQSGMAVTQGYACVRKTKGTNPFIAYAVINDGGQPGERTGDGAFISSQP
jgi:sugar lactone lactonase YvrE